MEKQAFIQSIIDRRKIFHLTQKKLSERTGISQQVLSRIEQENSNPTLDTLVTIANSLQCVICFIPEIQLSNEKKMRSIIDRFYSNVVQSEKYGSFAQLFERHRSKFERGNFSQGFKLQQIIKAYDSALTYISKLHKENEELKVELNKIKE